jgi:hypothetical protein
VRLRTDYGLAVPNAKPVLLMAWLAMKQAVSMEGITFMSMNTNQMDDFLAYCDKGKRTRLLNALTKVLDNFYWSQCIMNQWESKGYDSLSDVEKRALLKVITGRF